MKRRETARLAGVIGLVGVIVFSAGCSSTSNSTTATTPSPVLTTDTLTGTISPLGTASNTFTVNYNAAYTDASVTITSLTTAANGTPQSMTIGVGFGSTNLGACTRSATYSNPAAPLNTELPTTGAPFVAGTYCVQLFDNPDGPTVTEPLNYAITVKHY